MGLAARAQARSAVARAPVGLWLVVGIVLSGCGSSAPPPAEAPAADAEPEARAHRSGPSVAAEVGALDDGKTKQIFEKASQKLGACFSRGAQRIPYLAGGVSFYVRVASDGSARYTFVRDSTLGDRTTEECMLGVLKGLSWPKPVGGQEGEAKNEFQFDAGGDERPPVEWSPAQLGPPFEKAKPALSRCRESAGTGPVKATMYVDTDGKPLGVGVSTADEKGEAAVACIVDALKGITFPSPGSYASKVSVVID